MNCAQCGSEMNADARFCPSCGTAVASSTAPTATTESVVPPPPPPPPPASVPPPPMVQRYPPSYGYAQPVRTNGLAVASLVLGILTLCGIGSILALVFGYQAKRQIDESGGTESGRGMAVAGIVLGWIGLALVAIYVIVLAAAAGNNT